MYKLNTVYSMIVDCGVFILFALFLIINVGTVEVWICGLKFAFNVYITVYSLILHC